MPNSIIFTDVSWSAADGRGVLFDVNLRFGRDHTAIIGRNGIGKTTLIRLITGELQPQKGSVALEGTLGILRQAIQINNHETIADLFGASEALTVLHRAAQGHASVDDMAAADWTLETRIADALASVGLEVEPHTCLSRLSGGEITRVQMAALVFEQPDFLILDEPTNNLDRDGREAVRRLITTWNGGAIVVSHDRELLETMDAIVELTTLGATRYGGNWSAYRQRKDLELAAARRSLGDAERVLHAVQQGTQKAIEAKSRKDGAGRRKSARGDLPRILLGTLKDRSEDTSGENARLASKRHSEASQAAASARGRLEVIQPFVVTFPPTHLPRGRTVLSIRSVTAGYETGTPIIRNLSLEIMGPERIALTGANGAGKSTVMELISGRLTPWEGEIYRAVELAHFDQSLSFLNPNLSVFENFRRLNPVSTDNVSRLALARFQFRGESALQQVSSLSGGQLLRAGLACVLSAPNKPSLLLLDEPTNHLDLETIEELEQGLCTYDGALLVASHDPHFLEAIGITRQVKL